VGLSQGNGQLNGTKTIATDGNGRAQFNDLSISNGSGAHKLIFAADGFRSVTSTKIEVEKVSTTTAITGDSPDPSDPNQPVVVSFTVTSPAGTPDGDVEVSAPGDTCTATVAQGSCQISPTGSGNITATYKGNAVFTSSSATEGHTVNTPNFPPIALDDHYSTSPGIGFHAPDETRMNLLANDADLEGGPLTTTPGSVTTSAGGSAVIGGDGSFDYNPPPGFVGDDSFNYTVNDPRGASDVGTATISVN